MTAKSSYSSHSAHAHALAADEHAPKLRLTSMRGRCVQGLVRVRLSEEAYSACTVSLPQ